MELIVAVDKNFGIGSDGVLPWRIKQELLVFKKKTMGKAVVFGRKTYDRLPYLDGRYVYCLTKNEDYEPKFSEDYIIYSINDLKSIGYENVMIGGGRELYKQVIERGLVETIHISIINSEYDCDTFFEKDWLKDFVVSYKAKFDKFTHYTMTKTSYGEMQYIDTLKNIMYNGVERIGRNGITKGTFCNHFNFDLTNGFPLLTTKKMFLRGIVEEFLFFIRGETNSKLLEEKNVNIWKGNTNREFLDSIGKTERKEGFMGPMYGYQFRNFNAKYDEDTGKPINKDEGVDQLQNVIDLIKKDPYSRRILLTSYNPAQSREGVLYPCHSIVIQFSVFGDNLDMYAMSRSADMFLGIPFNIASYALLLMVVAKLTGKEARYLHISTGDTHIYKGHYEAVEKQINRIPYHFPILKIEKCLETLKDVENLRWEDFNLLHYKCHGRIRAEMVA